MKRGESQATMIFAGVQILYAGVMLVALFYRLVEPFLKRVFLHFYPALITIIFIHTISIILAFATISSPSRGVWYFWLIRWLLSFVIVIWLLTSLNWLLISPEIMPSMHPWMRMGNPWEAVLEAVMTGVSLSWLHIFRLSFGTAE